jgi:hypothetical protein
MVDLDKVVGPSTQDVSLIVKKMTKGHTHSIRSLANQWKDLINKRKPNIRANGTSNSSRKMVKASNDSVMKNQSRS